MDERNIVAIKLHSKNQPGLGLIQAIAEEIDGRLTPITEEDFCQTKQVFIVGKYEEIESKFRHGELFKIRVEPSQPQASQLEKSSQQCKYKSFGTLAEKLSPSEIVEVIPAKLPNRNSRILGLSHLPSTTYILIQDDTGSCFGPLAWEDRSQSNNTIDIELKFITGGGLGRSGRTKQVSKSTIDVIKKHIVPVATPTGEKFLLQNILTIASSGFEEYASDIEIIEYVKSIAGESAGRLIDRKALNTLTTFASNGRQGANQLTKSRIALFNEIVEASADQLESMNELFDGYLKNDAGAKIVEDHIQKNRTRYIDQLKREREIELDEKVKKGQEELHQLKEDLESRRKEAIELNDQIESKRKKLESDIVADQQAYLEKVSQEIQRRINDLNQEEESSKKRIIEIREALKENERIAEIKTLILQEEGALNYLKGQIEATRKDLVTVREETRREDDDLRKKLRGMKPFVEHINSPFTSEDTPTPVIKTPCFDLSTNELIHAQRAVIDSLRKRLTKYGRSFTDTDIANLLISTQQSFITFLAGLPGVGKTSLCKLFTESQGISNRLHNVSVARGWTATKDMIGFHNPLSDRFQPAPTGLYEFLKALNEDSGNTDSHPMAYILLDEANLSSIEHYWSAFMGMTDSNTNHPLVLGPKTLTIPKNLRFFATINYDGTTEPLSERILDRASVIVMQPGDITLSQDIETESLQPLPISSANMEELFGLYREAPELEAQEKAALDAIQNVLRNPSPEQGRPIHIRQRKIIAIRQYCARARSIMSSSGNEITALDLAITQHVLPQVRGHGNKFANRLTELHRKLDDNGLELSSEYLRKMIAYGQNDLHSYDFFCW
ncbi:hypothetical protein [Chromobacterium haemolyticum]|uniref:hypothetical protein n=1 Tax=Chromobacterium haemolyticum TaxID=394935 RepID=UPI000A715EE9|nr:hypothetical protein [Chromobacterium haemolyticum]